MNPAYWAGASELSDDDSDEDSDQDSDEDGDDEDSDDGELEPPERLWSGPFEELLSGTSRFAIATRKFYRRHDDESDAPIPDAEVKRLIDSLDDFSADGAGVVEFARDLL